MRRYETICIADPDLNEEGQTSLFDKIKTLIAGEKGILVNFDQWGNKQLAYDIRKKARGYYVCITYGGTGALVTELERNFRLDDRVLKFMTILLAKEVDPEALKQEKEAEEALNKKAVADAEEKTAKRSKPEPEKAVAEKAAAEPEAAEPEAAEPEAVDETESVPESLPEEAEKDPQITEEEA